MSDYYKHTVLPRAALLVRLAHARYRSYPPLQKKFTIGMGFARKMQCLYFLNPPYCTKSRLLIPPEANSLRLLMQETRAKDT